MATAKKLITEGSDGTISFGNFDLPTKEKTIGFEIGGNLYDIRSFKEITKVNKDEALLYESIPGTMVSSFEMTSKEINFLVLGEGQTQITMELSPETKYNLFIDDVNVGRIETTIAGKVSFAVNFPKNCDQIRQKVQIKKI